MTNLPVVEGRSCEGCTKCCEGYLDGNINGQELTLGKPCFLVEIGKGCTDYENRPESPCKTFQCEWLINKEIPDFFKPSNAHVIMTTQESSGIKYLNLVEAGTKLDSEVLSWSLGYAIENDKNLAWSIYGNSYWLGDDDFDETMQKENNIKQPITDNYLPKPFFDGMNPKFSVENEN